MDEKYLKIAGNVHLSYFIYAAEKIGLKYEIVIPGMTARFFAGDKWWYINNTVTPLVPAPSARICKSKGLTNKVLENAHIPVPKQQIIHSMIDAISFFGKYKDIVLKPVQNIGGKGITILPKTEDLVIKAYEYAKENDRLGRVVAEKYIKGDNYRLLVLGDKVISVIQRTPAFVIGDGTKSIDELIEAENIKRKEYGLLNIEKDLELENKLKSQELSLTSVPESDRTIFLRSNANLTTGGTAKEIINTNINPYYIQLAIDTAKVLDMEYAGIDLITPDIYNKAECAINEVNYNPGIRLHYKSQYGEEIDVAVKVLEYIRNKYIKK